MLVFVEGGRRENPEKTLGAGENQQKPQPTHGTRLKFKPGPHNNLVGSKVFPPLYRPCSPNIQLYNNLLIHCAWVLFNQPELSHL